MSKVRVSAMLKELRNKKGACESGSDKWFKYIAACDKLDALLSYLIDEEENERSL